MWHPVLKESEIESGKIFCTQIDDKKILFMRSDGKLYSCGAMCPHQGVSMEDGWVFDDEITCPEHSWVFSLQDGSLTWPGAGPRIPIYPIRISEGFIEIELPSTPL